MEFIDLKRQQKKIIKSLQKRINNILNSTNFIFGKEIFELEEKLAQYVGVRYCLTCASGTDALLLPLMAKGIKPNDAVFTTTFTFIATAEVISLLGATPIFVDIDPQTYNIDTKKLREEILKIKKGQKITEKISGELNPKAIIPVDLFGLCADYDEINKIAQDFNMFVLEDAAQSFGATYKGKKACGLGYASATSFFPAKPLGCYGDGGAVFCNDEEFYNILKSLRVHGQGENKYENIRIGINGRMDTIQAAVLLCKLEIFDLEFKARQKIARRYSEALSSQYTVPHIPDGYESAWAQYSIQHFNREIKMNKLKNAQIPTAIYYPKPLHLQKAFSYLGYEKGQLPVAEKVSQNIFSIPMHPYLSEKEQDFIIKNLVCD